MIADFKSRKPEKAFLPAMILVVFLGALDLFQMGGGAQNIGSGALFFSIFLLGIFALPYLSCREILKKRVPTKNGNLGAWIILFLLTCSSLFVALARFMPGHKSGALDSLVYLIFPALQIVVFGTAASILAIISKRS